MKVRMGTEWSCWSKGQGVRLSSTETPSGGKARGNKQDRRLSERADAHAAVRPGRDEATGGNVLLLETRQKDFSASGAVVIMDKINKSVSGFGEIGVRNIFSAVDQHSAIP